MNPLQAFVLLFSNGIVRIIEIGTVLVFVAGVGWAVRQIASWFRKG